MTSTRILLYWYILLASCGAAIALLFWSVRVAFVCLINCIVGIISLLITDKKNNVHDELSAVYYWVKKTLWFFVKRWGFFLLYWLCLWNGLNYGYFGTHGPQVVFVGVLLIIIVWFYSLDVEYKTLSIGYINVNRSFFWLFPGLIRGVRYIMHFWVLSTYNSLFIMLSSIVLVCLLWFIIWWVPITKALNSMSILLLICWFVLWWIYAVRESSPELAWEGVTEKIIDRVVYIPLDESATLCSDDTGQCPEKYCKNEKNICIPLPDNASCVESEQSWSCDLWYDQVIESCILIEPLAN